jgi:GTP-binding protein HflX
VIEADIILHVRDVWHQDTEAQSKDVDTVLTELGIGEEYKGRLIEVWNKTDLLDEAGRLQLANIVQRQPAERRPVLVSAMTGEGMDDLVAAVESRLSASRPVLELTLDPADGAGLSWLHRHTELLDKSDGADGTVRVRVRVDPGKVELVTRKFGAGRDDSR